MSGFQAQYQITHIPCVACNNTTPVATVIWNTITVYCKACGAVLPPPILPAAPVSDTVKAKPVKLLAFPIPIEKFRNEFDI